MLERFNPLLRLVCLALAGLVIFQASRLVVKREVIARGSMEMPAIQADKPAASTNHAATNATSTNVAPANPAGATNTPGAIASAVARMARPPAMPRRGGPPVNLPPDVQAAIDKIKQSQILGPEIKPPPMALLGIAGKDVFLRGPNGQTGVIREGEDLGGVKLVRIGVNRVLVEEDGQQKELTIFNGLGGETLMPQKKDQSEPPQ